MATKVCRFVFFFYNFIYKIVLLRGLLLHENNANQK